MCTGLCASQGDIASNAAHRSADSDELVRAGMVVNPWSQICDSMLHVYAVAPAEQYDVNKTRLLLITAHCKVALSRPALLCVQKNVLGGKLECCCTKPMTGFYRDGYCRVGPEDHGVHSACSEMTTEFLEFSASRGNDLRGVVSAGERWCLCVSRCEQTAVHSYVHIW